MYRRCETLWFASSYDWANVTSFRFLRTRKRSHFARYQKFLPFGMSGGNVNDLQHLEICLSLTTPLPHVR
jgi:hypothetical protein